MSVKLVSEQEMAECSLCGRLQKVYTYYIRSEASYTVYHYCASPTSALNVVANMCLDCCNRSEFPTETEKEDARV